MEEFEVVVVDKYEFENLCLNNGTFGSFGLSRVRSEEKIEPISVQS